MSISFSSNIPTMSSLVPKSISAPNKFYHSLPAIPTTHYRHGIQTIRHWNPKSTGMQCTKSLLSEVSNQGKFPKMAAQSTGPVSPSGLIEVVKTAAQTGAEVVMDAVNKPRNITYKGLTDLVTE